MRRLKQCHSGAYIGARGDANTADLRRQGIRQVISVQIQSGDHRVVFRAHQYLLQHGVGNDILDNHRLAGSGVRHL